MGRRWGNIAEAGKNNVDVPPLPETATTALVERVATIVSAAYRALGQGDARGEEWRLGSTRGSINWQGMRTRVKSKGSRP
jgi:hypothetical protein